MISQRHKILSNYEIENLLSTKVISGISEENIQPASFDLPVGNIAIKSNASSCNNNFIKKLEEKENQIIRLDKKTLLEKNNIYYIKTNLNISEKMMRNLYIVHHTKSSISRIDVLCRLVGSNNKYNFLSYPFEDIWIEVVPRTFNIIIREGDCLSQITIHDSKSIFNNLKDIPKSENISFNSHLGIYIAKSQINDAIDISKKNFYKKEHFFEFKECNGNKFTFRNGEFYIVSYHPLLDMDQKNAGILNSYNPFIGEFQSHFAGFFDPGFGYKHQSNPVLELKNFGPDIKIYNGDTISILKKYHVSSLIKKSYRKTINSNYQGQKLKLSKFFC